MKERGREWRNENDLFTNHNSVLFFKVKKREREREKRMDVCTVYVCRIEGMKEKDIGEIKWFLYILTVILLSFADPDYFSLDTDPSCICHNIEKFQDFFVMLFLSKIFIRRSYLREQNFTITLF